MRRWHSPRERAIMLRRWRQEISLHGGHDGWQLPRYGYPVGCYAPIPPITEGQPPCHCFHGPGFFRKTNPLGCPKPRCGLCKPHKRWPEPNRFNKRRAAIAADLAAEGMSL